MTERARITLGLGLLAWVVAMLAAYYYTHKPVTPEQAPALGRLALTLLGWTAMLASAHGLGRASAPRLALAPPRERLALRLGVGLGVVGLILLGLGALGGLRPLVAWPLAGLGLAVGLRPLLSDVRAAAPAVPERLPDRALALFVLFMLGLAFVSALTPPAAWDALVYHLTGPKLYVEAGRVYHDVDLPYLGFPHWSAMLYTGALLLGADNGAQIIHFTFAVLTLALLPGLAQRAAPGRGWLAAALLLSAPALGLLAGWAYVEWMTMFCVTAALVALLNWRAGQGEAWLILAGVFGGLSLAAKYTSVGSVAGLGVAALVLSRARPANGNNQWRPVLRAGLVFGAVAAGVALPWLLKNWALTGNPVYPFFLPGKYWDAYRAEWYGRGGTGMGLAELIAAPWTLMVVGAREEDIGPLWLALLPLLVIGWRRYSVEQRRSLGAMLAACGVALAAWLGSLAWSALLRQYRLLYPVFPLLAVAAAAAFHGLGALATPRLRVRWVCGGLIGLVLVLAGVARLQVLVAENPLPVLLGQQSRDEYLTGRLGLHYLAMQAVNELPDGHNVVFLWEPRSYYCRGGCQPDALLDRWWHLRRTVGGAGEVARLWRAQGVTHVLVFAAGREHVQAEGFDPFTKEDWGELDRLVETELTLVQDLNGGYLLYALNP